MKKKWFMHAVIILIILPAVGSTACHAQFKHVKQATSVPIHRTNLPKVDTSKLKPGEAPVRPKENKPVDLTPVKDMKQGMPTPPAKAGSIRQVGGLPRAHAPAPRKMPDSNLLRSPATRIPVNLKPNQGTRSSINPQPLPPGSRKPLSDKTSRRMINPQPLPPGSRMQPNNVSKRMIHPKPLSLKQLQAKQKNKGHNP